MMYFAPPKDVPTTVWSRVPDQFRTKRRTSWADANQRGAELDCFLEGPAFDREGNLWVVDVPFGRLFRIAPGGQWTLAHEYDGEPNGLAFHRDGRLFIADYRNGIMAFDPRKGTVDPVMPRRYSERLKGPNDLVFGANGDLYFTDQGQTGLHDPTGRVYRLTAAGRLECLVEGVPSPNGIVLNKDESALFVGVTRANAIWRVPLMLDGGVSKVGMFVQLSGGVGPDSMAIDDEDGLLVCHIGLGTVWHFSRLGEPLHRIRSCAGLATTNAAFGAADGRSLFITEAQTGQVLRAELPAKGLTLYSDR
ncbi:MAG: SMP-30/gluconolactonase/LRE family protein [Alphaproteobacteria bacterium]|nr:SMP-30/gluconolactonase/LRE family protein [Alphaproteobacteria bacterium]